MSRSRAWCFVINNYTASDEFAVKNLFNTAVEYGCVGKEVGKEKGTPHLQGYCRLKSPWSLAVMKKHLVRAKLIVANGGDMANQVYSSKESLWLETGTPSEQGKRNDIHDIAQLIKNKEITLEDLMFEYPLQYVKYSRSFEKMFNAVMEPRSELPEVHWRYGSAGTGKTRYCIDKHPSHYIKDNTSWWDGYIQQEAIIIDDFDDNIPYRTLLRILDRYKYLGQVKGSYVQINSPYIYITSEHPPSYYWSGNELAQVTRRLTSVQEIN